MNKAILMGRLTRDPEVRYTQGENSTAVARYTLAVDRKPTKDGKKEADFISCVTFGKQAEFVERYLQQGTKIAIVGRIQTGSYEKDGKKVYTTDVFTESIEFAESKKDGGTAPAPQAQPSDVGQGFMDVPEGYDEGLPFN